MSDGALSGWGGYASTACPTPERLFHPDAALRSCSGAVAQSKSASSDLPRGK
jgi:hypothetical protein